MADLLIVQIFKKIQQDNRYNKRWYNYRYVYIYKYNGNNIKLFRLDNEILFKGKNIATILGYVKTRCAVSDNVNKTDCTKYEDLYKLLINSSSNKKQSIHATSHQPGTIFINQAGLFSLIMSSKLSSAVKFKKWIIYDILPKIFNYGSYTDNRPCHRKLLWYP